MVVSGIVNPLSSCPRAIRVNFNYSEGVMAAEFRETSSLETIRCDEQVSKGLLIAWEPHALLKLCAKGLSASFAPVIQLALGIFSSCLPSL